MTHDPGRMLELAGELEKLQIDMLCKDLSKVEMARVIVAGRGIIAEREKALLSAAARVGVLEEENARLRGMAGFLIARIDELDWCDFDRLANDWNGHVDPPLCRLRSALASIGVGGA